LYALLGQSEVIQKMGLVVHLLRACQYAIFIPKMFCTDLAVHDCCKNQGFRVRDESYEDSTVDTSTWVSKSGLRGTTDEVVVTLCVTSVP
jgi:hypothetical protein